MGQRFILTLAVAICGWLLSTNITNAQLTREWSYDTSTLANLATYARTPVIIDDSGNTYILTHALPYLSGARITKLRPDSTIDWQFLESDSGLYLDFFGRTGNGDIYVAGHHERPGGWTTSIVGIKIDANGGKVWSQSMVAPGSSNYWFNHPFCSIDLHGNLWMGITESLADSVCPDSLPQGWGTRFQAVVHRLDGTSGAATEVDRIEGEPRQNSHISDVKVSIDGYINVSMTFGDYCCNSLCQGCRDSCFTQYNGWPTMYRTSQYLRRYTAGGGFAGSTWLAASDNEFYSAGLTISRSGELYTVTHRAMSPTPYWGYLSRFGAWTTFFAGEIIDLDRIIFDFSDDLYAIWYEETSNTATVRLIDGATGSVLWTRIFNWGTLGVDREGNLLLKDYSNNLHKCDEFGNEVWIYNPGYDMGKYLHADTSDCLYYLNYRTLSKYSTTKDLVIRDANNDSIPNVEFELIKVRNNPPLFTEDTLGMFTTDDMGRLRLELLPDNKFLFVHSLGADTLAVEDTIKIAKHVFAEPARKHEGVLGTMYSVHLDNIQIDGDGSVSFLVLDDMAEQEVLMNHTEYRYNLLVSVEWDAEAAYLEGVQQGFRRASNFLYDVTDGQMRLDTIMLFDNDDFQAEADVRILATNMHEPDAMPNGIFQPGFCGDWHCGYPMTLPRKWYDEPAKNRDSTYKHHPLSAPVSNDYRTIVHEFGHYALAFRDEYVFYDASWNELDPAVARCQPRPAGNYGFMDYQFQDAIGGMRASEMSSQYRYDDPACQNTDQFIMYGLSCWDFLELWAEGTRGLDQMMVPILKPDVTDPEEREPTAGYDYIIGPNHDVSMPDYDVGTLMVFPQAISAPPVTARSLHVLVNGVPAGGVLVSLMKPDFEGGYFAVIQGNTTDLGLIWVLGADRLRDYVHALGHSWSYTTPPGLASATSNYRKSWLFGELELSSAGDGDSVTVQLSTVSGDLPMIASLTCDADSSATIMVETPAIFSNHPSVSVMSVGVDNVNGMLETVPGGYRTTVSGVAGSEGVLRFQAEDDQQQPFFFDAFYVIRSANQISHVVSGPGGVTVSLDSSNTSVERVALVSSAYPVPIVGLGSDAIQAGKVHTVSVSPTQSLVGINHITIHYADTDLVVDERLLGEESSLQLYSWGSGEWVLLGGVVDTVENTVSGSIPGAGVYGAFTSQVITDVDDEGHGEVLPYRFELSQNYPNPFNPVTSIAYSLPARSHVTIEVYNVLGQKVRTLVEETKSAGSYRIEWNGNDDVGRPVSTGVYLYRFQAGNVVQTKKMLLLK